MPKLAVPCTVCGGVHNIELTDAQARPGQAIVLICPDVDRRYRLANFQIAARRGIYNHPYGQSYAADDAKRLQNAFGVDDFDAKFERWKNIAYPTLGIIDEYPPKIEQIISAYSMGYVYPAVTSSCCLAERILNRAGLEVPRGL